MTTSVPRQPPKQPPLTLVPSWLKEIKASCPACRTEIIPDLLTPTAEPVIPVKPADQPADSTARWIPHAMGIQCPNCPTRTSIPYPVVRQSTRVEFYGDDAARREEGGDRRIVTYSLVGVDFKLIEGINKAVRDLKLRLAPDQPPESWWFHMTVLQSGQQRRKHPVFSTWDRHKTRVAVDGLFEILALPEVIKFNVTLSHPDDLASWAKREAWITLITYVIDNMTVQGAEPAFVFDSEKPGTSSQIVHSWARDLFLDAQYSRVYTFITRGIEIGEPRFVRPASHPCLELADFLAYVVARGQFDHWSKKVGQFDTKRLGDRCISVSTSGGTSGRPSKSASPSENTDLGRKAAFDNSGGVRADAREVR